MSYAEYECLRCKHVFGSPEPEPFCYACRVELSGRKRPKPKATPKRSNG